MQVAPSLRRSRCAGNTLGSCPGDRLTLERGECHDHLDDAPLDLMRLGSRKTSRKWSSPTPPATSVLSGCCRWPNVLSRLTWSQTSTASLGCLLRVKQWLRGRRSPHIRYRRASAAPDTETKSMQWEDRALPGGRLNLLRSRIQPTPPRIVASQGIV